MKILITPVIQQNRADATWHLTRNLVHLLADENAIALSAPEHTGIPNASLYPCPSGKAPLFRRHHTARTYEEWLYKNGCFEKKYLEEDLNHLLQVINSFQPDLIITMGRPMAEAAADLSHTRCFTIVHPAMNRRPFPTELIYPLNSVLSEHNLVQVTSLRELMMRDEKRFGFGPIRLMPFPTDQDVIRIGNEAAALPKAAHTNRVCIFLNDVKKPAKQMKQVITDAFHGAPYAVYASFNGSTNEVQENIHFLSRPRPDLIFGSIAVIHDGNDYYANLCMSKGIVQVAVTNHDFIRMYNGQAIERAKIGKHLYEENLDMSALYNAYRTVLSDDSYDIHCKNIRKEITNYGDLSHIADFI